MFIINLRNYTHTVSAEECTLFGLRTEKHTDLQIKVAESRRSESIISKVSEVAVENWNLIDLIALTSEMSRSRRAIDRSTDLTALDCTLH